MKNFIFIYLISLLLLSQGYSNFSVDNLQTLDENIKTYCFEYTYQIPSEKLTKNTLYKGVFNQKDIILIQDNYILPTKTYDAQDSFYKYSSALNIESPEGLQDDDTSTYIHYNIDTKNSSLALKLESIIEPKSSIFNFLYLSQLYSTSYDVSLDGKTYTRVSKKDIQNYSFQYIIITFHPITTESQAENIKIHELSFTKKATIYAFTSLFDSPITAYAHYNCSEGVTLTPNTYDDFIVDNNTEVFSINLEKNKNYVEKVEIPQKKTIDADLDGILNIHDNCIDIPNTDQLDDDGDTIGDACDNCKNIKNTNQADIDKNNTGDMCEDSDLDNILGYLDNCIYVPNSDQKDDNNNGIGDVCEDGDEDNLDNSQDNCPYIYNPEQIDTDMDGIGDKCDDINDTDSSFHYIISNIVFGFAIIALLAKAYFRRK